MSRRGPLALGALAIFACYTVHMDEQQVTSIAAGDMDCDRELIDLEIGGSPRKDVARYTARGCEKTKSYDCVTNSEGHVSCDNIYKKSGSDTASSDENGVGHAVGAAAAGCACASLFGSHSSDPSSSSPASNPNAATPQRNR